MNGNYEYPSKDPIHQLKQEMKLRRFSPKTIKSYLYYITAVLKHASKSPKDINTWGLWRCLKSNWQKVLRFVGFNVKYEVWF